MFAVIIFCVLISEPASAGDLGDLVPSIATLGDIKRIESPRSAEGEDLFKLINGGAVLFFQHQFKRALFQEFEMADGKLLNLEIYQMGSSADARAIFQKKKGDQTPSSDIGELTVIHDYYLLFAQGPYFVTVTGEEATGAVRKALIRIARAVERKIIY